jgi:Protein of unknown function (DUF3102)
MKMICKPKWDLSNAKIEKMAAELCDKVERAVVEEGLWEKGSAKPLKQKKKTGPETFEVVRLPDESAVEKINDLHESVNHQVKTTIEIALQLGEMLEDCRKSIGDGGWQKWIKDNLTFSYKTAFRYLALWKARDPVAEISKKDTVSLLEDSGLTAVYRELDVLSRNNEVDREEVGRKQNKRLEAEERKWEREEEADKEALKSTPRLSPEEFDRIKRETEEKPTSWTAPELSNADKLAETIERAVSDAKRNASLSLFSPNPNPNDPPQELDPNAPAWCENWLTISAAIDRITAMPNFDRIQTAEYMVWQKGNPSKARKAVEILQSYIKAFESVKEAQ